MIVKSRNLRGTEKLLSADSVFGNNSPDWLVEKKFPLVREQWQLKWGLRRFQSAFTNSHIEK